MVVVSRWRGLRTRWSPVVSPLLRLVTGVGASALATYAYLILVARELGPVGYATFSAFWAAVVILGAGVYLPIEQETARRGVGTPDAVRPRRLGSAALSAALLVTVGLGVLLLGSWPALSGFFSDDVLLAGALVLGGLGYSAQFPARGLLSAGRRYGRYASVLGTEALLRVLLVVVLVVAADPGPAALAAVVGLAALGSALAGVTRTGVGLFADGGALHFLRSAGMLIAGAVALQTLLYSGVLVARALAPPGQAVVAGQLLAAVTVTRIPIFLFQSVESLVIPRIAELAANGDTVALRSAVRRLVGVVAVLGTVAAVGSATLGPWLVELMFGPEFRVSRGAMALLGVGTGLFMLAVAASDITVSLAGHAQMAVSWLAGLAAGGLSLWVLDDLTLRITVPLIVGSCVAALLAATAARSRLLAAVAAST